MRRGGTTWSLRALVRRGRELPALALATLWLGGLVLAPLSHLALHASIAPHSHATTLEHDGHRHEAPARDVERTDDLKVSGDAPVEHGRGSPLHGDVAALFPAPAIIAPPFVPIGHRAEPATLDELRGIVPPPRGIARGPPRRA